MGSDIKMYILGIVTFIVLAMATAIGFQHVKINSLTKENTQLTATVATKEQALKACSDGVLDSAKKQKELDKLLQIALEKAKIDANAHYNKSDKILLQETKPGSDYEKSLEVIDSYLAGRGVL